MRLPVASRSLLTLSLVLSSITGSLRRHPKRMTASLAALLLGTGVTAFGVAPLAPDAADLPVRQILEAVQPLSPISAQTQLNALANFNFTLFRTESTRSSDTAASLLKRLNLDDAAADAFLRSDPNAQQILTGRAGKNVTVEASESQQLRKGDRFNVVYETLEADGEVLGAGRVLSAEFVNEGKAYQAMWFQPPGNDAAGEPFKGGYYSLNGQSLRRAFLSSPVEFSRISSGFSMRFHPILQTWRAHNGTDFAAATGTPARTVGDGVVEFAGVQNGFGNVVFVKHANNQETVYAHLSKINVQQGQKVSQGQTIGLVGMTGWATGPHLHFEVRVNGVQQDPMTMARQSDVIPVPAAAKAHFKQLADGFRNQLQAAATIDQTRAE